MTAQEPTADPTPSRNLREDPDHQHREDPDHPHADNTLKIPTADDDTAADDSLNLPQNLDQARKLRSENKALRERAQTAETRLAAAHHADVERIAGEILIDPTDVWTAQPDMSAFYDDEFGQITADKVVAVAKELAAAKPHLAKPPSAPPPTDRPIEGLRPGAAPEVKTTTPSWSSAIRGTSR
jgi:hypothetical protein